MGWAARLPKELKKPFDLAAEKAAKKGSRTRTIIGTLVPAGHLSPRALNRRLQRDQRESERCHSWALRANERHDRKRATARSQA